MEKRMLGNSDLDISVLGLGSWAIGGNIGDWGWGEQNIQDSIKTIHTALDNGINWIDTAPAYGLGNSERVVAKALKQSSYRPYIFTKCGFRWNEGESELLADLSRHSIREEIELSLARLNVDCIDLYQIHKPNQDHLLEQAWETLTQLKQEGKVRHIGVSNFSVTQLERVNKITPITSLQPPYSLINREIEQDVLPWCLNNQVGTIHHSAMSHGLLTGTWDHQRLSYLDAQDWRRKSEQFQEPEFSRHLAFVNFLQTLADKKQCSVAQLSIAWTLAHPATTGTIIGARTRLQLKELLPAAEIILSPDELKQIDTFRHS